MKLSKPSARKEAYKSVGAMLCCTELEDDRDFFRFFLALSLAIFSRLLRSLASPTMRCKNSAQLSLSDSTTTLGQSNGGGVAAAREGAKASFDLPLLPWAALDFPVVGAVADLMALAIAHRVK